ncbi:MAG: recombinase family protein [Bacilli bacterium]|nr:recombinase family protein [Bacilli bacterium]
MEIKKITALYCRLSREDERNETSSSIETQKRFLKRYASEQNLSNTRYYVDDGYSGTNFERPAFQQLLRDIENKIIENIIVKDLSRLGRNYLTTGLYIEHHFPINNVRFIAVNDQVDSNQQQNDLMPFRNIMNEWYARDISQKIRTAYKTKAINGEFTGPSAPYGYAKDPNDKNHLIIDQKQARVIREIFEMYINGFTIYKIVKHLKQNGILTPRARTNLETGKYILSLTQQFPYDWSYKSRQSILSNEEYIGNLVCNRHSTTSYKSKVLKLNPKDQWIITEKTHQAIIDFDTFQKAQLVMQSRYRKKVTKNIHLFMGLIRCDQCGRTLTYSVDKRRRDRGMYVCSTYRTHGISRCTSHYLRYDFLCKYVYSSIENLVQEAKRNEKKLLDSILGEKQIESTRNGINIESELIDRLETIRKVFIQMYEDYALEKIPDEDYHLIKQSYEEEKQSIKERLEEIHKKSLEVNRMNENIHSFISTLKSVKIGSELSKQTVDLLIEKIVVSENKGQHLEKSISIYYKNIGTILGCASL